MVRFIFLILVAVMYFGVGNSYGQVESPQGGEEISDAHMRLEEEVAKWKSAGGIVDLRGALLAEERPGVENAADIYKKLKPALDRFLDQGGSPVEGEDAVYEPYKASMQVLESTVREFSNEIDLLKKAAEMDYCFWGEDYAKDEYAYFKYVSDVRHGAVLLRVNVYYQWKKKNSAEVERSFIAILNLGGQVGTDPLLIPQMVKWAVDDLARGIINRICASDSDFHSLALLQHLEQVDVYEDVGRAICGEVAYQLGELMQNKFGSFDEPLNSPKVDDKLAGEIADYLRDARVFLDAATKPVYEGEIPTLREPPASWGLKTDYKSNVNSGINQVVVSINRQEAVNLVIVTGLRLREYKAAHGDYPEPGEFKMPVDPLDGKRMIYLRDTNTGGIIVRTSSLITRLPDDPIGTAAHVPFEIHWK